MSLLSWLRTNSNTSKGNDKSQSMADIEVQNVIEDKNANQRKKYKKYSSAERARIAKHAIQFGTPWACMKYGVPESLVRSFKKLLAKNPEQEILSVKARGRPPVLGTYVPVVGPHLPFWKIC